MRISDWSSDVCSSDLQMRDQLGQHGHDDPEADHVDDDGGQHDRYGAIGKAHRNSGKERPTRLRPVPENGNDAIHGSASPFRHPGLVPGSNAPTACHRVLKFGRSEEHTSELQSLMRISYAVFCLKKKNKI